LIMRMPRSSPRHAFTLIEVLLAVAITAGIVLVVFGTWSTIVNGTRVGLKAAEEAQRKRITMRAIEESLSSVVIYGANIDLYAFEADGSSDEGYLSFVAKLPETFPGSSLFPGQPMRRVTFKMERSSDGRTPLIMTQHPFLQKLEDNEEAFPIEMARDVKVFAVELWDYESEDWVDEWENTNSIPPLVRIGIAFGNRFDATVARESVISRTIALSGTVVPAEMQIGNQNAGGGGRPPRPPSIGPGGGRGNGDAIGVGGLNR